LTTTKEKVPFRSVEIEWQSEVALRGAAAWRSVKRRRNVWWECWTWPKVDYHMARDYQTQMPQRYCKTV
jgi:hypothetical protein